LFDDTFNACVRLLQWMARKLGTSYEAVNVLIFCVAVPLIILGQSGIIVWLLMRR